MWRLLGLTLVFVAGAAATANAGSRSDHAATGVATALQRSAAVAGARPRALNLRVGLARLQFGGALAFAQPSLRAAVAPDRVGGPRSDVSLLTPVTVRPPARRSGLARWLDLDGSEPALAYPVTETLSLGLGYRFLRSEDLVFKVAKTGSLDSDYQSHNLLLQAHWEF
jgi:hypothetical protein